MIGVGSPGNQLPSSLETRLTGHGKAGTGPACCAASAGKRLIQKGYAGTSKYYARTSKHYGGTSK
jgi:hypothetical protein